MRYRTTQTVEDLHRVVELELEVWGLNPIDAVPANVLAMTTHTGGVVILAEDETVDYEIVGFAVGFPARRGNSWLLWSHITGVHPNHQGRGIGRALKLKQRAWASQMGYTEIGWTFDPLQAGNANFNLNVLGAVALRYHPNFYGRMADGINNQPLPSDRLEARWKVREQVGYVTKPIIRQAAAPQLTFLVEYVSGQSTPRTVGIEHNGLSNTERFAIQLPDKQMMADVPSWQLAIRQAFQEALLLGYRARQFMREPTRSYYVLTR